MDRASAKTLERVVCGSTPLLTLLSPISAGNCPIPTNHSSERCFTIPGYEFRRETNFIKEYYRRASTVEVIGCYEKKNYFVRLEGVSNATIIGKFEG